MKLTQSHIDSLNRAFPPGFLLEPIENSAKRRRNEVESLQIATNSVFVPIQRPVKPEIRKIVDPDVNKPILELLNKLKSHPQASVFVDNPGVSLVRVEEKVRNGEVEGTKAVIGEVRRMWQHALATTRKGSEEYMAAIDLGSYTEALVKQMESQKQMQVTLQLPAPLPMTFEEKRALSLKIRSLDPKYLRGIFDIVKGSLREIGQEFEFDLDSLPANICRGLAEYVEICAKKAESQAKQI